MQNILLPRVVRQAGWHCCQYDIDPEEHPGCARRLAHGCEGCTYAMWRITSRMATEADLPQEGTITQ